MSNNSDGNPQRVPKRALASAGEARFRHREFTIKLWGVRGSLPSPGSRTATVGGNTACVEVLAGPTRIVLDAGTGLRVLGERIVREPPGRIHLLLSHLHGDHLMGLPFFPPLYRPGNDIAIHSGHEPELIRQVLRRQMSLPTFPVDLDQVGAQLSFHARGEEHFAVGEVRVATARLAHPGITLAYRLEYAGRSFVYATDHEHGSPADGRLVELARGADLMILDAQYTPEEYAGEGGPAKRGWGHATYVAAAELGRAAEVKVLALFHHDPARSDGEVAVIEDRARRIYPATVASREGMSFTLGEGAPELEGGMAA
jgi:phosphoribosyl 1,2-cyclic phosphodiesterase